MYLTYMPCMALDPKPDPSVPAHQVQRHWGEVADQALRDPVVITSKGRPRHVLMAYDEYQRLKARDRRAYRIEDMPDDLAAQLDAGLDDLWNPNITVDDGDVVIG
jgi:prevent-host-death family protein